MNFNRISILLISFLSLISSSYCQSNLNSKIQQADSLVKNKEYQQAEKLYREAVKEEPENNTAVYKLASLYYTEGKYEKAIENYLILAPNKNPIVLYNLACSYSLNGNKPEALKYLSDAVNNGFNQLAQIKSDPDLKNIRNEKKFYEIISSIKSLDNFPEAKSFDFWVGEWNVFNRQKQKSGESRVEKILKDAVILENWEGNSGYTGKSFNHFNMDTKKWDQYWVDQNSNSAFFEGNYDSAKKAMVFYSYDHAKDRSPFLRRLTFFNLDPDTVRQFAERSGDEGKTWLTEYDLMYIRKENGSK